MVTAYQTGSSRVLRGLVVLLLVFTAVATLAVACMLWATWSVPDGAIGLLGLPMSGPHDASVVATFADRFAFGAVTLVNVVVTMIILVTLLRMLRTTRHGSPFVTANVGRLRLIAGAFASSLLAKCIVPWLVPPAVADWLAARGWSFNLGDLGALLLAAVLAEVFREGVRLREDSDATV